MLEELLKEKIEAEDAFERALDKMEMEADEMIFNPIDFIQWEIIFFITDKIHDKELEPQVRIRYFRILEDLRDHWK